MADIQILGANTDTRSQIKNLWASLNQLTAYVNANSGGGGGGGGGSGTGNVLYNDTTATVGQSAV